MAMGFVSDRNMCLLRLVVLLMLAFLSIVILVPFILIASTADGRCLLFLKAGEEGESEMSCLYIYIVTVIAQFVLPSLMAVYVILKLLGLTGQERDGLFRKGLIFMADLTMFTFTTVSVGFISMGFTSLCDYVESLGYRRCDALSSFPPENNVAWDPKFYGRLTMAHGGAWISFALWLTLVAQDLVEVCYVHGRESREVMQQGPHVVRRASQQVKQAFERLSGRKDDQEKQLLSKS